MKFYSLARPRVIGKNCLAGLLGAALAGKKAHPEILWILLVFSSGSGRSARLWGRVYSYRYSARPHLAQARRKAWDSALAIASPQALLSSRSEPVASLENVPSAAWMVIL